MKVKKLYKRETFKSREDWLNNRGMGGSSASAIMFCNPYQTAMDLYRAIKFPKTKETDETNESMKYGIICEDLIRKQFAIDFAKKYKVHKPLHFEMFRRKDKPYMTATLDGILTDIETKEKYILEIKTRDIRNRFDESNWTNSLPQNYFIQLAHYLLVMNDFKGAILVAKLRFFNHEHEIERQEIRYYKVMREDIEQSLINLENAETKFYEYNIANNIPPTIKIRF